MHYDVISTDENSDYDEPYAILKKNTSKNDANIWTCSYKTNEIYMPSSAMAERSRNL